MPPNAEVVAVTVRFPKDLRDKIQAMADQRYLGMNDWVVQACLQALKPEEPPQNIHVYIDNKGKPMVNNGRWYGTGEPPLAVPRLTPRGKPRDPGGEPDES